MCRKERLRREGGNDRERERGGGGGGGGSVGEKE